MNSCKFPISIALFFLAFGLSAQNKSPRQAGSADLDAWSRATAGTAGFFTNPDTEDWIPFTTNPELIDDFGVLDASQYVERPSGQHGFLRQDNQGNFVFEDGTPGHFLGGQIYPFPEKEDAEWIVQWMRKYGLNYARSHGFGLPTKEKWDKLDYLLFQCKQAGIYLILTPIYWTEFDVIDPAGNEVTTSSHLILFFNQEIEHSVRELWRDFYTHVNPYTGLRYADDPTLMAFELKNEDSPFWALDWIKRDLPVYWTEIKQQFSTYLQKKYGTTSALRDAWTLEGYQTALAVDESLEKQNIDLFEMSGWHVENNDEDIAMRPRKSDQTEFLHQKLVAFYERSYQFLRDIGCKQAISGSNWRGHSYSIRHVLEADARMDYVDQHDYFDHPQGGWRTTDAVQHNQSMLKSPQAGLIGNLAPRQVLNRPYTVSEWNIGGWNEHLLEASFAMISTGLLQGWDGLMQFILLPKNKYSKEMTLSNDFFNIGQNPSVVQQYPTLSRMWYRKDIREADPVFIRRISPDDINQPGPIQSKLFPSAFMFADHDAIPNKNEYGHLISLVGKVGNEFVDVPQPHFEAEEIRRYLDQDGKTVKSMNGDLFWDWGNGYMVIDTENTQGACGYIGEIDIKTQGLSIRTKTPYGLVLVTTLDDNRPIRKSGSILVTALGRARNSGLIYGNASNRTGKTDKHASNIRLPEAHRVAVLNFGESPIITEPIKGELSMTLENSENAQVFVLDDQGQRIGKVPAHIQNGELILPLPGDHKTRFFEVAID